MKAQNAALGSGRVVAVAVTVTALLFVPPAIEAANDARVLEVESAVPSSVFPGATAAVRLRVRNEGTTIWRANDGYRLGAGDNELPWHGQACGGYMRGVTDGRVFLCHDVPPGATYDFQFQLVAPATSGSFRLSVRMVRDGVEWFGESQTWHVACGDAEYRRRGHRRNVESDSRVDCAGRNEKRSKFGCVTTGSAVWRAGCGLPARIAEHEPV